MPLSTRTIGTQGESLAKRWLLKKGFQIVEQNYHGPYGEIDIVAKKEGVLHFVEVKMRLSSTFGSPIESITKQKYARIQKTVYQYLNDRNPTISSFQIDFIGIRRDANKRLFLMYYPSIT